jgi:hypothetical protein
LRSRRRGSRAQLGRIEEKQDKTRLAPPHAHERASVGALTVSKEVRILLTKEKSMKKSEQKANGTRKPQVFTELGMKRKENRIPQLAENAVKQARTQTLASGRSVVEVVGGQLVETRPDGTQTVLKDIPAPTPVVAGQKRVRRVT